MTKKPPDPKDPPKLKPIAEIVYLTIGVILVSLVIAALSGHKFHF